MSQAEAVMNQHVLTYALNALWQVPLCLLPRPG